MPSQKKTAVDSLTEELSIRVHLKKPLHPTNPTDVSNVNVPQKKKQKKNAIISTLGTRCNPKGKKDLDEDPDYPNVPHPPAVETNSQLMYATGHKQSYASFLN